MSRLFKALLKLLKGKVKIHIGAPGSTTGIDINFDQQRQMQLLATPNAPVVYNLWNGLWKVTRSALLAVVVILLSSGGLDAFFNSISSGVGTIGLPEYLIPIIAGAITLIRTLIKQALLSIPKDTPTQ